MSSAAEVAKQEALPLGLLIAVFVIGMFAFVQVYAVQAILPLLMQAFSATPDEIGFTVGATVLAVALMSPFMGMLSDAVGRKSVIVASLLFLGFPTAMMGFADSLAQMNVWRFLQGLAVPGITVVLIAYIGEEFIGRNMTKIMSLYVSGTVFGGFSGRFILGHLTEYLTWQQAFWVMAATMLAGVVLAITQLPASKSFVPNRQLKPVLQGLWSHLHNRYVLSAMLLGACVLFSLVGCFTFVNLHLAAAPYHLSSAQLANIFMVYLIGMIITPLSTRILTRLGAKKTAILAVLMSMVGVVGTLVAPLWEIVVALGVMSSGVFITQSATISYIAKNVTQNRSLASGLYYMGYYTGGTIGAAVCGWAYARGEWNLTVGVLLLVQVFALLVASVVMVSRKAP
ncbi:MULTISPECIES: MFS transporter [Vitreoscilla]|uniref:MFS transporter n=1 Tax=Vitreoscilla stercoraria TaxID=61 RepID=A0ABY4E9A3_VITST|nr:MULTISPECIES: MFS transporter [Vitreoscilla]QJQ52462.1 MFS transporter [Vitreoscilla sp. C1]UOO92321.1 MFS transporter [Vitreoscilla stercoraria]